MAPAGHLDPLGEEMSSAQVGVQGGDAALEVDEGGKEKNRNGNATVGGLRSRVDNLAERLGNQQRRTRLLNAAVCSDILLLRTPFFFGYALGRFSYSFSWMFLVCQISNATFTASRSRRSDKRLTFNMNSLSSAAANAATCIEWNLHVLAVLILCWILGQHPQSKTSGRPPALAISNPKIIRSPPPIPPFIVEAWPRPIRFLCPPHVKVTRVHLTNHPSILPHPTKCALPRRVHIASNSS